MYKLVTNNNSSTCCDIFIKGIIQDIDGQMLSSEIKTACEAGMTDANIHINSYGGSVRAAWDIVTAFKTNKIKTKCINEGFAVSAASVILAASDYSEAYDYSMAMIHDPLLGGMTLEDTQGSDKEFLTKTKDGLMAIYLGKMNVDQKTLSEMMTKETSFNATEQKQFGLVNEVIPTSNKPTIPANLSHLEVYNIIEEFNNNKNININNKTKMKEVIDYLKLDENVTEQEILNVIKENEVKVTDLTTKLDTANIELVNLKTDNFILSNKLEDEVKINKVRDAVKNHGITILDTIASFITIETKTEEQTKLVENIKAIVEEANDVIDNIIDNAAPIIENKLELANKIFDLDGDQNERLRIKNEEPALYNELWTLYTESL